MLTLDRARTLPFVAKIRELAAWRELMSNLTLRELRGKYKRSVLGWAWSLLNPLATLLIFTLVFRYFFRFPPPIGSPSGLQNYALFLLAGLLPWNFVQNGIMGSIVSLTGNANLIKKTWFPRELLAGAAVASAFVTLLIELGLLVTALLLAGNMVLPWLPVTFLLMVMLAMFTTGLGLMFSVVNVFFRDVQHLVAIAFQMWFYLNPIVYPIDFVKHLPTLHLLGFEVHTFTVYKLNPMVSFVMSFRDVFYDLRMPPIERLGFLFVVSVATLLIGQMVHSRLESRLAEEL